MLAHRASYDKKTLARQVIPLAPGYRTALSSRPAEGKKGRPRETWPRTVERALKEKDLRTLAEAALFSADRIAWRQRACSPILH